MNSRSVTSAPARYAGERASGEAGFVVFMFTCPRAASSQQHCRRMDSAVKAMIVDDFHPADAAAFHYQICREFEFTDGYFGESFGFGIERALNFASGGIAVRVQNPITAVRAFASKCQLGAVAVELSSPCDQFFDSLGCVFHQDLGGFWIAETIASHQRVLEVQADFILVAQRCRDSALCVFVSSRLFRASPAPLRARQGPARSPRAILRFRRQ